MTIHNDTLPLAILAEVASALSAAPQLPCHPIIEQDGKGVWTLRVVLTPISESQDLDALEVGETLRRLQDLAQLRGLAQRYQLDPALLAPMLGGDRPIEDNVSISQARLLGLADAELKACVEALADPHLLREPEEMDLIDSALPKLRRLIPKEAA